MIITFDTSDFAKSLIAWFRKHKRDLPWRKTRDPYAIWISEIMLQQTRVEAVIPYYEKWLAKWPTIDSLAGATEVEVLAAWKGLGYYSRARNILKTARLVKEKYHSTLPREVSLLLKLPGIGRYTAGAISSLAYHLKEPLVDGNVLRVYARIFACSKVINDAANLNFYYQVAEQMLPDKNINAFNQGLMELGAVVCVPNTPRCQICPVQKYCRSFAQDEQDRYPVRQKKKKIEKIFRIAFVIQKKDKVFLTQREKKGIYFGMWELPSLLWDPSVGHEAMVAFIRETLGLVGEIGVLQGKYMHTFTNFKEEISVYSFTPDKHGIKLRGRYISAKESVDLPMSSVQTKIIESIF